MVGGLKRADGTAAVLEFALVNPGLSRAMAEEEGGSWRVVRCAGMGRTTVR
jgi:hypothetical protein